MSADPNDTLAGGGIDAPLVGPRRGETVSSRYEVRNRLRDDAFTLGFLAHDRDADRPVLLRVVRPELLDPAAQTLVAARLQPQVGRGGEYMPGLLDVGIDRHWLFTTEPVPEGVCLRDVVDRRVALNRPMTPREVLPVAAQLEAALASIDRGFHGDVRADQVWVSPHKLQLIGPFLIPALPPAVVQSVRDRDGDFRRRTAPELARGEGSPASDLFGVAAIIFECLTLRRPPLDGAITVDLGPVTDPLQGLIGPKMETRESLEPAVEALARWAGIAPPELDPKPFRNAPPPASVSSSSVRPPVDDELMTTKLPSLSEQAAENALKRPHAVADGTIKVFAISDGADPAYDKYGDLADDHEAVDDDAKTQVAYVPDEMRDPQAGGQAARAGGGDAKRTIADPPRSFESNEDVPSDPNVPAAPGANGTMQIDETQLDVVEDEEEDGVPLDPAVPALPTIGGTMEVDVDEVLEFEAEAAPTQADIPRYTSKGPVKKDWRSSPKPPPRVLAPPPKKKPQLVPVPEPTLDENGPTVADPPRFLPPGPDRAPSEVSDTPPPGWEQMGADRVMPADLAGLAAQRDAQRPGHRVPRLEMGTESDMDTPPPAPPRGRGRDEPTEIVARPRRSKGGPGGARIIILAVLAGLVIIMAALLYRKHREKNRVEQRQRDRIEQRLRELQGEEAPAAPAPADK